jgi:hypothetical protein
MKRKQSAQGLGFNASNETAKELSKQSYKKQLKTIEVSDVWREYESKYSNLKTMLSFVEFKRIYNKSGKKGINKELNRILRESEPIQVVTEFKPKINRVTKDGKIIPRIELNRIE